MSAPPALTARSPTALARTAHRYVVPASPVTTPALAVPAPRLHRPKSPEVRFNLETNSRVKNRFGKDVFARILRMRLRAMTTAEIAKEIGCSRDLIEDQVRLWEMQIDIAVEDMPGSTESDRR